MVGLPHPFWSGDSQGQESFLVPSGVKEPSNYDTHTHNHTHIHIYRKVYDSHEFGKRLMNLICVRILRSFAGV